MMGKALSRPSIPLFATLGPWCAERGLPALAEHLGALEHWLGADLADVQSELAGRSARHILARGGKRLRPVCVALAARAGAGFSAAARELAVAVELVHAATLLHDDVVDLGEVRRGAPAARALLGNAASIFAGD